MSSIVTAPQHFQPSLSTKLGDFDYEFPRELIAKYPAQPRDSSRLMVVDRQARTIEHRTFRNIGDYFNEGDVLVVNDTQVFPARLMGNKEEEGARVEVFLLRELNAESRLWDALVNPARKIRVGNKLFFDNGLIADVIDNTTNRGRTIRFIFDGSPEELYQLLDSIGTTPIPPYLRRSDEPEDAEWYQTIFASKRGAVAAPTAGLHFTDDVLTGLKSKGTIVAPITLHVGLGTFHPVEVEDLSKHQIDSEYFEIPEESARAVNGALISPERRVTVCGTTCVRAIESCISAQNGLKPGKGWTDKFIYPPYTFKITERLLTNFHMPKSSLLMLVCAFADSDLIQYAYQEAIKEEYRLFSYGDAMLIL